MSITVGELEDFLSTISDKDMFVAIANPDIEYELLQKASVERVVSLTIMDIPKEWDDVVMLDSSHEDLKI